MHRLQRDENVQDERIVISYDPTTGKLEFSAPKDQLEKASDTAQVLIKTAHACLMPQNRNQSKTVDADPIKEAKQPPAAHRHTRKSGESSGRPGRLGSFEKVDFGLTEDQERAIYEFYTTRRPPEQKHQIAVAMYIGEKVLGRQAFDYNEIYTLMYLGGEKDLPKAIDVVIGQLQKDNWLTREGRLFTLKFLARDYVEKLTAEAA
jgi:hypothetical protein